MAPTKTLLVPSLLVSVLYSIPNFRISQHKIFINVVFPYTTRYYIRIRIRASLLRWRKKTFEGESKRPEGEGDFSKISIPSLLPHDHHRQTHPIA